GRLTHPKLGVSRTTPLLVSSGPGAPTPTPTISALGCSRRVCSMVRRARAIRRSRTSLAPASAWVGSLPSARSERPSSDTLPTTRLVPPMSTPRMNRTSLLQAQDGQHSRLDLLDRKLPHTMVVPQRTDLGTVTGTGSAA